MKASKLVLVALTLFVPLSLSALRAEESGKPPMREERPGKGGKGGKGERGERGDRLAMLKQELALTPDQIEKVKPILDHEREAVRTLMEDTSTDRDAKRPKMREIRESHNAQIRAILTPDQQAKFDAMRPAAGKKRNN